MIELLKAKEDEHLDRVRSLENRDSVGEKIAAFASASGGYLLIGQNNDKTIRGIEDEARAISGLGEILHSCEPTPTTEGPAFLEVDGKKVAVLKIIALGKAGPCFYRGSPYMRVMDRCEKIAGKDLYKIWMSSGRISFEERPSSAPLDTIDLEVLEHYTKPLRERGGFNRDAWLENRKNAKDGKLTNLGVLVLARSPGDYLPRPQVTLLRFKGSEPTERIAALTLSKPLHKLLPSCEEFLRLNLPIREKREGLKRTDEPVIPWGAIREALVNALAHRDYEAAGETLIRLFADRIEFINPGAPDEADWKKIIEMKWPIHRNPLLYEFVRMEEAGEGAGQGIVLMKKALEKEGLPPPEFHVAADMFMVVMRTRSTAARPAVADTRLLEFLKGRKEMTTSEVMGVLKVSRPTALRMMEKIVRGGSWRREGSTRKNRYYRA